MTLVGFLPRGNSFVHCQVVGFEKHLRALGASKLGLSVTMHNLHMLVESALLRERFLTNCTRETFKVFVMSYLMVSQATVRLKF